MIDFTVARDKLAQFETADEIADFFRGEGIKGWRRNNYRCPIAKWMSVQTQQTAVVGHYTLGLVADAVEISEASVSKRLPNTDAMKEFIDRFDNGHYFDLDENWINQKQIFDIY